MTNDYKERIIKWLTGNYTIEPSGTTPLFQELNQLTTTINDYFDEIIGYIQGKDGKGNDLDIGFIYGNQNNKGVIAIVDSNFTILQVITEYNTGTDFHQFVCLNIDNTNGNIAGIDKNGNQYRFILLNNFLVKTPAQSVYEVKLRNSYMLSFTENTFIPKYIEKKQTEAFYIIVGTYEGEVSGQGTYIKPAIATYQINVGSVNELNMYLSTDTQINNYTLKAYNIIWNEDTYSVKMSGFYFIPYDVSTYYIYYEEFSFDGTTITELSATYVRITASSQTISYFDNNSSFVLTNNESYITYTGGLLDKNYLKQYDYNDNTFTEIDSMTTEYGLLDSSGKVIKVKNQLFYFLWATDSVDTYTMRIGKINHSNGQLYLTTKEFNGLQVGSLLDSNTSIVLNVSNTYNLYTYNIVGSNSNILLNLQQIFNELNYNYDDYEDLTSLVPNSAWLYSNNEIVYARNLYNKVLNGNITISTIEVPNMLLNDISITPQQLLGKTNGILINNTEIITKNIYEDLFINFYNELTMQDQNTQDYIINLNGATRLNTSISNTMDYNNAKITKIRMNYEDNTTFVKTINPATQISQFVYQFSFDIYVPNNKTITSVEIISNDENTTYQTINTSSLLNGKTYKITQNVEIEEG